MTLSPVLSTFTIKTPAGVPTSITVWGIVTNTLNVLLPLGAVFFVIMVVYAGISYIMTQGDMQKVKTAQAMISNSIIGFIIMLSAFFLLQLVNYAVTGNTIGGI